MAVTAERSSQMPDAGGQSSEDFLFLSMYVGIVRTDSQTLMPGLIGEEGVLILN